MLFDLKLMMIMNYRPPVLRRLKRRAGAIGSRAGFVVAVALLVLASAAWVAIPVALGILLLESERAKRGLGAAWHFVLRPTPTASVGFR